MLNKKKLTDFHLEKSSALKKLESYAVYEEEDEDAPEFEAPKDFRVFKGNEKALKNKIATQNKLDLKNASKNNFTLQDSSKVSQFVVEDSEEYNEVADEWQDVNEFSSPLDFNYANSTSVKGAKKASQPVNSVFIGTALKQIQENQARSNKQLDEMQKHMDKKIAEQKKQEAVRLKLQAKNPVVNSKAMGWSFFGKNYSSMNDYAVGIDYINKFHEANKTSALQYVNGLYTTLGNTKTISSIESLGFAIKQADMSEGDVQSSARNLASYASGKVPASIGAWFYALQDQASQTPFTDFIVNNPIVQATQKVGDTIIKAGETVVDLADSSVESVGFISKINRFLPFVIPLAVGYVAFKYFGGIEGAIKAMKKQNPKRRKNRG
jgi:hypothetical protein